MKIFACTLPGFLACLIHAVHRQAAYISARSALVPFLIFRTNLFLFAHSYRGDKHMGFYPLSFQTYFFEAELQSSVGKYLLNKWDLQHCLFIDFYMTLFAVEMVAN